MKKIFSFLAAVLFAGGMMAETYTKTAYADLKTGDVVILTMTNASGVFAASNDQGTAKAPVATAVTVASDAITTEATNIIWTVVKDGEKITFKTGDNAVYCTNTNNGVRVGTGEANVFSIKDDYLYNDGQSRYIGVYNSQDWRCYTTINSNIKDQTLAFYVKGEGGETPVEPQPTEEWTEIVFTEAVAAADLAADASFNKDGLVVAITDSEDKFAIDANTAKFGTAEGYTAYDYRLKTGGKSQNGSKQNFMTITLPADGQLRLAVRPAGTGDRALVLKQADTELYNAIVTDDYVTAEDNSKVYSYITIDAKAGTIDVTYPDNSLNFYAFAFKAGEGETPEPVLTDPTNCAEAAAAALTVSANNEEYNGGKVYTIEGYVTSIATPYNDQYKNISFWMADTKDGGNVLEAYRAACATAADAPAVGDKVAVTGKLTKYGKTPEFAAGSTYTIVEKGEVIEPKNLGEKTIAEFLALKNTIDTCVITGEVYNIYNTTYGNLYLVEGTDTLNIYGVLTPAGEAKQFESLGVAEGDTMTVKAVYREHNGKPQPKDVVFVSVEKKAVEPKYPIIETYFATGGDWDPDTESSATYDAAGEKITVNLVLGKQAQWQAQVKLQGPIPEAGKDYKVALKMKANKDLGGITLKWQEDNNTPNVIYENQTIALTADAEFVYDKVATAVLGEKGSNGILVLDFGYAAAGTVIEIYDIVIEEVAATKTIDLQFVSTSATVDFTDAVEDEGWWQLRAQNDTYFVTLSNAGVVTAVAGTYTVADLDPDYSFVELIATEEVISLVSGSVTVAVDEDGNVIAEGEFVGSDGNTYKITIICAPKEEEPYKYDDESDYIVTFDSYTVNETNLADYGSIYIIGNDGTNYINLDMTLPAGATAITPGTYTINDTYDPQTVYSGFYHETYGFIPSFAATLVEQDGKLYYNQLWYIVSGTVTVDENLNVVVDAVNSLGKAIKVTLKAQGEGIDNVDAATKAVKFIKNGNLIIERNGVQYNVNGAVIR